MVSIVKNGVYGTLPMPEWKHKVLKFVAKLLFLRDVSAVIIVHGESDTSS